MKSADYTAISINIIRSKLKDKTEWKRATAPVEC